MQSELHFPEENKRNSPSGKVWTVSRLNQEVRHCLESRLGAIRVQGEISNLRRQPSGHQYFSLKDETCQVSCVMFRGSSAGGPSLSNGMEVELSGEISVYEPRGQYQIIARRIQLRGAGELEAQLRALQEKLRAEGLFDQARKKPLPSHPVRVGVVTSPAGAAIRDFLQILNRRAPHIEIFIAPVRVQGRESSQEIAAAVNRFACPSLGGFPQVDVIVVTRGGGSLEDLWAFHEEVVARAIAQSLVPVISAVGHEVDITTADLVADVRAPTPSAAAEILSADRAETHKTLALLVRRLGRDTAAKIRLARAKLEQRTNSMVFQRPRRRIADLRQWLDDLGERRELSMQSRLALLRQATHRADSILRAHSPAARLAALRERLGGLRSRQLHAVDHIIAKRQQQHSSHLHTLEILGPRQTLARGFAIALDPKRRPLTSAQAAAKEDEILILFADGEIKTKPRP